MLLAVFAANTLWAQSTRITTHNSIGWYNYFGTFKVSKKWSIHSEYQLRRSEFITQWQQSLLRLGINYQVNPEIQIRVGYGWIETFPYGEIPINGMGKDFTEHRIFQMVTISDKISLVDVSHRFMLEQRWMGSYSNLNLEHEDEYTFLNRIRYMLRVQLPLKGKEIADRTPYVAVYDELFIGFGSNVKENVYDQNRIGMMLGYRFNPVIRVEAGYLNQILQLAREVDNKNVFQVNSGFILNANFNIDLSKKVGGS